MIKISTKLIVADNSGAKIIQCIGFKRLIGPEFLGRVRKKSASVGDIIVASIKEAVPKASVKKGEVIIAVVVRSSFPVKRPDGSSLRFDNNSAVIINKNGEPIGTRVFGPIPREVRKNGFIKVSSLSPEVI